MAGILYGKSKYNAQLWNYHQFEQFKAFILHRQQLQILLFTLKKTYFPSHEFEVTK